MGIDMIRKRDGREVPFDQDKIEQAIFASFQASGSARGHETSRKLTEEVVRLLENNENISAIPSVEQVQDTVEQVLMRNGFEGFKEIQERTLDVARYLAAELKEMGIFEIYEDASHIPIVCWGLKDDADVEWSLYDLSDRLRMSGWLVPAYPMPADMQDTTVQRVVARADFSMQLCIKLVEDMKKEMDTLNKAKFVTGNTQGVIQTGFNHGGRSAVDKGEKVQTKAKSNQ